MDASVSWAAVLPNGAVPTPRSDTETSRRPMRRRAAGSKLMGSALLHRRAESAHDLAAFAHDLAEGERARCDVQHALEGAIGHHLQRNGVAQHLACSDVDL